MTRFPFPIKELDTPSILLDRTLITRNIEQMQSLADRSQVRLRPHIKSHKSIELAKLQLQAGATGVAVAKLSEAEVMAAAGINDIQIANQIVGQIKIERLAVLSEKCRVSCAVDSIENVHRLKEIFAANGKTAELFIEIDTGLHRAGLSHWSEVHTLAAAILSSPHTHLAGLLTHAGQAYAASDLRQIEEIGLAEGKIMVELAERLRSEGIEIPVVSVGSTPTARFSAAVPGVTELRVGNYIFNDAIQVALGVATWEECALSVLATVTAVHADRWVLDAGSKVFSSDTGAHGSMLLSGFGRMVGMSQTLTRLSEEHAVVASPPPDGLAVGDRVRIIPNHACPVMNLAERAWLVDSGSVIQEIRIDARAMTA
ncbi:MAG: alanine racemase [bacterium]|nr:alanine racemase [bacterium]